MDSNKSDRRNNEAGYPLGGGGGNSENEGGSAPAAASPSSMTPEQLRAVRLARFENTNPKTIPPANNPSTAQVAVPIATTATATVTNVKATSISQGQVEDDDDELQKALAMSLLDANNYNETSNDSVQALTSSLVSLHATKMDADETLHIPVPVGQDPTHDDEDRQLQEALKLSLLHVQNHDSNSQQQLQQQQQQLDERDRKDISVHTETSLNQNTSSHPSSLLKRSFNSLPRPILEDRTSTTDSTSRLSPSTTNTQQILHTRQPFDPTEGHKLLWDPHSTVIQDQKRWLSQGIWMDGLVENPDPMSGPVSADPTANVVEDGQQSRLTMMACHPKLWGLKQEHGGPCGVLAGIQAEMLRLLLFGGRGRDGSGHECLKFPGTVNEFITNITSDGCVGTDSARPPSNIDTLVSPTTLREALALSIGMILARAALQPPANASDGEGGEESVDRTSTPPLASVSIKLVLPRPGLWDENNNNNGIGPRLTWNDLSPWPDPWRSDGSISRKASATGLPLGVGTDRSTSNNSSLEVYTIQVPLYDNERISQGPGGSYKEGTTATNKRLKRQDGTSSGYSSGENDDDITMETTDSTTLPLEQNYTSAKRRSASISLEDDAEALWPIAQEFAHKVADFLLTTNAISWFHVPGGVLLLVLSLIESRTASRVKEEFDDPFGSHLTSQFGHCSQELLNLCLTGQATGNVFDNTMKLQDTLLCRGVQSRPSVGYLTQLEALRYCEVGGYYKSPRFPIWVVGSTSHFSVMFGGPDALVESSTDVLLEKVRRAFKRQPGAEESGFIQVSQLGDLLRALKLDEKVPPDATQTLAASMEVHGAGIILWEDLWKNTSRLLSGDSLESVVGSPQISSESAMTDEELARQLQAEWNGDSNINSNNTEVSSPATTAVDASTVPSRQTTTMTMYHFNGLRGGTFTTFSITKDSGDAAIGASVSLVDQNQHQYAAFGGGSGSLTEVLRTKWPSATFQWSDTSRDPPSID